MALAGNDRGGRAGRPTREAAAQRDVRLLETATRLFLEHGFDGTSMDAVAEQAGVGKPTLYARYRDKRELFEAVLTRRIDEWIAPVSEAAECAQDSEQSVDLASALDCLSRAILSQARHPEGAALRRVIAAQSLRFPDIARLAHEQGWVRAVDAIARIFRTLQKRGQMIEADPQMAAELFLGLLLWPLSRATLYGVEVDPDRLELQRKAAIEFFTRGYEGPWRAPASLPKSAS